MLRLAAYIRNSLSESRDPWHSPAWKTIGVFSSPSNTMKIGLSELNLAMVWMSWGTSRKWGRISISWLWAMRLKALSSSLARRLCLVLGFL